MLDRPEERRSLFLAHLAYIERVAAKWCRMNGVWGQEAEDFVSEAMLKLMENDCAVLSKFRGECEVQKFLAVVAVQRLREHARERWGRWRNSVAARGLGALAMELEVLVYRDRYTLAQAGEKLRVAGKTAQSDAELARLLAQFPVRRPLRPEGGAVPPELLEAPDTADRWVEDEEREKRCRTVMERLREVLGRLEPEERVAARMRFAERRKVGEVARALCVETRPLFRRLAGLRLRLRESLEAVGVTEDDMIDCLGDAGGGW